MVLTPPEAPNIAGDSAAGDVVIESTVGETELEAHEPDNDSESASSTVGETSLYNWIPAVFWS